MSFESDSEADRRGMRYVAEHQERFPTWLLMYSLRDRGLLAIYRGDCPRPGIIVAASDPDTLLHRMQEEAVRLWAAQPGQGRPMPTAENSYGRRTR